MPYTVGEVVESRVKWGFGPSAAALPPFPPEGGAGGDAAAAAGKAGGEP